MEKDLNKPLTVFALLAMTGVSYAEMPHNRRCDIAQDHPGNLNPGGGNAIMFGLCGGIEDLPTGESVSRHTPTTAVTRHTAKERSLGLIPTTTMSSKAAGVRAGKMPAKRARRERGHLIRNPWSGQ
jgi:hypothetical protein